MPSVDQTVPKLDDFVLLRNGNNRQGQSLAEIIDGMDGEPVPGGGRVSKSGLKDHMTGGQLDDVLEDPTHRGRRGDTHPQQDSLPGYGAIEDMEPKPNEWYCFTDYHNKDEDWYPQGLTGTFDASPSGRWGGKIAFVVSWYNRNWDNEKRRQGVRLAFFNQETGTYQFVLLVRPKWADGGPSYEALFEDQKKEDDDSRSLHAGGVTWVNWKIFVPDTHWGIRVFDLRDLLEVDGTDTDKIGLADDGKYHAYGYKWILPQRESWYNEKGYATTEDNDGPPIFSFLSLDRLEKYDYLISGEYEPASRGRVAKWPINSHSGKPHTPDGKWHAVKAYRLPEVRVQGAVSKGDDTWYLSQAGEKDGGKKEHPPGKLVEATAGPPAAEPTGCAGREGEKCQTGVLASGRKRDSAIGPEDLANSAPGRDRVWSVSEFPNLRVIYSM